MSGSGDKLLLRVAGAAVVLGLLSLASTAGLVSLSLIDQVVLAGFALVMPLVIGEFPWWWAASTGMLVPAFALPRGVAALAVLPAVVAAMAALVQKLRAVGPPFWWDLRIGAETVAIAYGVVAAVALFGSRSGVTVLGIYEPIVELTAVHYTFAGAGALCLAADTLDGRSRSHVARTAVVLTGAAPPVVALGFVTTSAVPQVGGAVLMAIGVWLTAALELADVTTAASPGARVLLAVSGLAIWLPMVLAVAWAAGAHWDVPALSIPDMARTHGLVNAFAFVLAGLVARHRAALTAPRLETVGR